MVGASTNSREALRRNLKDVERLLTFSANVRIVSQRTATHAVLNKSGVVLLTAAWENYCEDVGAEVIYHIAHHGRTFKDIPVALQKRLARELEQDQHELAVWRLAGDGWRTVLTTRVDERRAAGRWGVQSPIARRIAQFFADDVGVADLDQQWHWANIDHVQASAALDDFVSLRHAVAHGRSHTTTVVSKTRLKDYRRLIIRLADITDRYLEATSIALTDSSIWAHSVA